MVDVVRCTFLLEETVVPEAGGCYVDHRRLLDEVRTSAPPLVGDVVFVWPERPVRVVARQWAYRDGNAAVELVVVETDAVHVDEDELQPE